MTIPSYKIAFDGEAAAGDIYEFMIRLEIEEDIRKAASFMFRLSILLKENGEWTYLDDDRLTLFKKVTISIGFCQAEATPVFEGCITHVAPHFDPQEELCYLEVRGMDSTFLMNLEEKHVTWEDQSHSDIASAIFSAYGITPDVVEASVTHEKDGNVLVQRGTDIHFLKELAARNGFDCYVTMDDNGEVKGCFKPYVLDTSALLRLAVHFEGQTNVQFLDIEVSGNHSLSFAGWYLSQEDKSLENIEKTAYEETLLGKDDLAALMQDKVEALSAPLEAGARTYPRGRVFLEPSELDHTLTGSLNRHAWFVKAKGIVNSEAYGEVIRVRRIIPVKGIGTTYSGHYLVSSVKHVISEGQYEQHVELIRNALGVKGDESF